MHSPPPIVHAICLQHLKLRLPEGPQGRLALASMAQSTHPAALLEASLQRLQARFTVDLHPSKLAAPMEGVREHLDGLLLRCVSRRSRRRGTLPSQRQ